MHYEQFTQEFFQERGADGHGVCLHGRRVCARKFVRPDRVAETRKSKREELAKVGRRFR